MAVPGMRHGHMDALWPEKRNPTVFRSEKNSVRVIGWVGGSRFGFAEAADRDAEVPRRRS